MVLQAHHNTLKGDNAYNIKTFPEKRRNSMVTKSSKASTSKKNYYLNTFQMLLINLRNSD